MHIGNTEIFYLIIEQPTPELEIKDYLFIFEYKKINWVSLKMWT